MAYKLSNVYLELPPLLLLFVVIAFHYIFVAKTQSIKPNFYCVEQGNPICTVLYLCIPASASQQQPTRY